jgi:putative acyl-CoA dehydrogenase
MAQRSEDITENPATAQPVAATHEVFNQPPALAGYNAYDTDPPLQQALAREGGGAGEARLREYGGLVGGELIEVGFEANDYPPEARLFDRFGHRIDAVDFHPAYHRSMALAKEYGLHGLSWSDQRAGSQVVRSALFYLHNQVEAGTMCPITMTHAAIGALRHQPELAAVWEPRILANSYDPRGIPAEHKTGLTVGMGMTEKQGGSDVRSNTTWAAPLGRSGPGGEYALTGHKWFLSAPMSDLFLMLAYTDNGQCCFLVPKWRPEGSRNAIHIQRLKDKLGDRSNASCEVELRGAFGWMVGDEGRGVRTILEMVSQTRLDCMLGSSGQMRQAFVQAAHHARHREAFGTRLIEAPLMQNVLADLALEAEAALALSLRVARAFDAAERGDDTAKLFARLATPIGKYWICKRTPGQVNEAQECLGGNGYIEESIMARLARQAPVNSIWEGPGNVQCLDALRAMQRNPESVDVLLAELEAAAGRNAAFDAHLQQLKRQFGERGEPDLHARRLVEAAALALQASLLLRGDDPQVAEVFCRARLGGEGGLAYGTLPTGLDLGAIVERAWPGAG